MEDAVGAMGLPVIASNQEYFGSQWEINLRHDDAVKAADDAHLFKLAVKEIAAKHGLVATFMGKPVQELGTSGHHHLSLWNEDGDNAFFDSEAEDELDRVPPVPRGPARARPWDDGDHGADDQRLQAVPRAGVRALERHVGPRQPDSVRAHPRERGKATRIENRAGDGTATRTLRRPRRSSRGSTGSTASSIRARA